MRMSFHQDGQWVKCVGGYDKGFVDFLRYGVRPQSYRTYDYQSKVWRFHHTWLPHVAPIARERFTEVDWSSLPPDWQIEIAKTKTRRRPKKIQAVDKSVERSPYSILYVTEDAPMEVVQASYKALARKHHPDVSGDQDQMVDLNNAYEEICKKRGC